LRLAYRRRYTGCNNRSMRMISALTRLEKIRSPAERGALSRLALERVSFVSQA
jgi:hypothetical protein